MPNRRSDCQEGVESLTSNADRLPHAEHDGTHGDVDDDEQQTEPDGNPDAVGAVQSHADLPPQPRQPHDCRLSPGVTRCRHAAHRDADRRQAAVYRHHAVRRQLFALLIRDVTGRPQRRTRYFRTVVISVVAGDAAGRRRSNLVGVKVDPTNGQRRPVTAVADRFLFPVCFSASRRTTPTSKRRRRLRATQTGVPRRPVQEPETGRHEATDVRYGKQSEWDADDSVDDRRHSTAVRLRCDVTVTLTI